MTTLDIPETTPPRLIELASALNELRERTGLSYRQLETKALVGYTTLNRATSGRHLPTWEVVERFVVACDGDIEKFRQLWLAANAARASDAKPATRSQNAAPGSGNPENKAPATIDDFARRLRGRVHPHHLSQREIARRVGYSATTVRAVLTGERLPTPNVLEDLLCLFNVAEANRAMWLEWRDRLAGAKRDSTRDKARRVRLFSMIAAKTLTPLLALSVFFTTWTDVGDHHVHKQADPPSDTKASGIGGEPATGPGISTGPLKDGAAGQPAEAPAPPVAPATPEPEQESPGIPSPTPTVNDAPLPAEIPGKIRPGGKPHDAPRANSKSNHEFVPGARVTVMCISSDTRWYWTSSGFWISAGDVALDRSDIPLPRCTDVRWPTREDIKVPPDKTGPIQVCVHLSTIPLAGLPLGTAVCIEAPQIQPQPEPHSTENARSK